MYDKVTCVTEVRIKDETVPKDTKQSAGSFSPSECHHPVCEVLMRSILRGPVHHGVLLSNLSFFLVIESQYLKYIYIKVKNKYASLSHCRWCKSALWMFHILCLCFIFQYTLHPILYLQLRW